MKEIFLLSGLGADKRVFDFLDLSGYSTHIVEWIEPLPEESLSAYARRLLPQITAPCPILMGVSFGGAVATEIGRCIRVEQIILISSIKTKFDLPLISRWLGRLRIHKILPFDKVNRSGSVTSRVFGAEMPKEKDLLKAILQDTDPKFLKWGLGSLMQWDNEVSHPQAILLHGTDDHVLPHRHADYLIKGGGHFMIVNRAAEISRIVRGLLG